PQPGDLGAALPRRVARRDRVRLAAGGGRARSEGDRQVTALEAFKQRAEDGSPAMPEVAPLAERRWWRWWQVAVAAGGFLVLLPVSLLIAIAIKLTGRGPILYRG